jgi:hypothetical protein
LEGGVFPYHYCVWPPNRPAPLRFKACGFSATPQSGSDTLTGGTPCYMVAITRSPARALFLAPLRFRLAAQGDATPVPRIPNTRLVGTRFFQYNYNMLQTVDIRGRFNDDDIILTAHVVNRMKQRHIRFTDIRHTIENGEIIEQYPTDYPFPSCLLKGDDIHVVCSVGEGCLYIITAYRPSLSRWDEDGRNRKVPR